MNHLDDHVDAVFSPLEAVYVAETTEQRDRHAARLKRDGQMMCWMILVSGFFGFILGWCMAAAR